MKIIEAMKQLKDLSKKAEDLRTKVSEYCAILTIHSVTYPDQKKQIREWIQAHHDVVMEMLRLRIAIQRTNLATKVTIPLGGKTVTKTLAAWVHRRRDLAGLEEQVWRKLTDRGLKEGNIQVSPSAPPQEVKIVRFYEPELRDRNTELYRSEPSTIDGHLEVVNATTELIEKAEDAESSEAV